DGLLHTCFVGEVCSTAVYGRFSRFLAPSERDAVYECEYIIQVSSVSRHTATGGLPRMIGKMLRNRKHTILGRKTASAMKTRLVGWATIRKGGAFQLELRKKQGKDRGGGSVEHYRTQWLHGGIKSSGSTTPARSANVLFDTR
ncbi:unnamed protein product, partial [Ectocarpus sp. 12 AP-2014]